MAVERSSIWDYAFLAIFMGLMLSMLLLSFASRANIAFFWIFAMMGLFILVLGVMLSNIWQEVSVSGQFSDTITRFPITDALLGSYFPMAITMFLFFMMIVLFGKFPGRDDR